MDPKSQGHFWEERNAQQVKEVKAKLIPFMGGRPERETIISADDIINLQIALGLYPDVRQFIRHI